MDEKEEGNHEKHGEGRLKRKSGKLVWVKKTLWIG